MRCHRVSEGGGNREPETYPNRHCETLDQIQIKERSARSPCSESVYTTTLRTYSLISDLTHLFLQTWVVAEGPSA